jgi:hypothetical protein
MTTAARRAKQLAFVGISGNKSAETVLPSSLERFERSTHCLEGILVYTV